MDGRGHPVNGVGTDLLRPKVIGHQLFHEAGNQSLPGQPFITHFCLRSESCKGLLILLTLLSEGFQDYKNQG